MSANTTSQLSLLFGYFVHCLKNYVVFKGRARRSEFFGFVLFWFLFLFCAKFLIANIIGLPNIIASIRQVFVEPAHPYDFDFTIARLLLLVREIFIIIYFLATITPLIAVSCRRLHDIGKSGFFAVLNYILWIFAILLTMCVIEIYGKQAMPLLIIISYIISFVYSIIFIVWLCTDSTPNDNKYGKNPKEFSEK